MSPYREGHPIVIGGKTIPLEDVERIVITYTDETSDKLLPIVKDKRRASGIVTTISDEWYVADRGRDVTDELITSPPGSATNLHTQTKPRVKDPTVIFVIHGRNLKARDALFTFLRSIGLHPLEWSEAVAATRKGSPYIGEILETAFSIAQAVVVLMTPDDEARLREPYRKKEDPIYETELTPQARPNVLFEAGMAMGRSSDRTILVELGSCRPFSDIGGRHVIKLNNTTERRQELAQRLQAARCQINLSGTDWHTAGDLEIESDSTRRLRVKEIIPRVPDIGVKQIPTELITVRLHISSLGQIFEIQLPWDMRTRDVTRYLSKKLGLEVKIGNIRIDDAWQVVMDGISLNDEKSLRENGVKTGCTLLLMPQSLMGG